MEYTYSCCGKTTIFNGTIKSFKNKVKQDRKCHKCKFNKNIDGCYWIKEKGQTRKMIKFNCDLCEKEITTRYDIKRKTNLCQSCLSKLPEHHMCFKKTQNGMSSHPIYKSWSCMKARCYNEKNDNYKWYGGKGITICDEWRNEFLKFFEWSIKNGWEKGLEIDRIDSKGNYEPNNCQWLTHTENVRKIIFKKNGKT